MSYDLPPPRAYGRRKDRTERLSENYPDLLAWVGEDELGSGKIGIKQASCTAGIIPMVAEDEHRDRMDMMTPQMRRQARRWGVTIRLVRYVAVEELVTLPPGS